MWEISVSRVREKNPYLGIYMGIVFPVVVACNLDSLSRHFGYCWSAMQFTPLISFHLHRSILEAAPVANQASQQQLNKPDKLSFWLSHAYRQRYIHICIYKEIYLFIYCSNLYDIGVCDTIGICVMLSCLIVDTRWKPLWNIWKAFLCENCYVKSMWRSIPQVLCSGFLMALQYVCLPT